MTYANFRGRKFILLRFSRFPDTKKKEKSKNWDKIMHSVVAIFVKYRIFNSIKRVKYRI